MKISAVENTRRNKQTYNQKSKSLIKADIHFLAFTNMYIPTQKHMLLELNELEILKTVPQKISHKQLNRLYSLLGAILNEQRRKSVLRAWRFII